MPYLIAEGSDEAQRWRRALPVQRTVVLGREAELAVPWDTAISRRHAELALVGSQLEVRRLAAARNPLFFRGQATDRAELKPGDCFVIGQTRFTLLNEHADLTLEAPPPDAQQTFTAANLRAQHFHDAGSRIDVLSRLPELFAGAVDDFDLYARLVNVLLLGIRKATAAALVVVHPPTGPEVSRIEVLHWDRRGTGQGDFHPSRRLILQALQQQQSVLHLWRSGGGAEFTAPEQADWALALPLTGEACRGWVLFVAGSRADSGAVADSAALHDDLKFAELVAAAVAAWRDNQRLRQRQAALKSFFAPQVLEAIARDDPQSVLAPRSADVTVMFCDLRGFSYASEQQSADLMGLLKHVSLALGVATRQILEHGGVVGDFHGDAVMGFWGWPIEQSDKALLACQAALAIQEQLGTPRSGDEPFASEPQGASPGRICAEDRIDANQQARNLRGRSVPARHAQFRLGIGIASGPAVAGQIGTADQAKVTVFGPVVNLAARLEGLTQRVGADVLVDEATAVRINAVVATPFRAHRIATLVPAGMQTPVTVSRLLSAEALSAQVSGILQSYEQALQDFEQSRWERALVRLEELESRDPAAAFLLHYIRQNNQAIPPNFDGIIRMSTK